MENLPYQRLLFVAEKYFTNLSNMATMLGEQRQYLYTYKTAKIGNMVLEKLRDKLKVNPDYILKGEGEIFLSSEQILVLKQRELEKSVDLGTVEFQRLRKIAEEKYGTLSKLAKAIGKDSTYLYTYKNKTIGRQLLGMLKEIGIDIDYITGENGKTVQKVPLPVSNITDPVRFGSINSTTSQAVPFRVLNVNAGGGFTFTDMPAGYMDIAYALTENKSNIFFAMVNGDSMTGKEINSGDLLVIEETQNVFSGQIVVCQLNGVSMVKKYEVRDAEVFLTSENSHYQEYKVLPTDVLTIFGVAIKVLHNLK